MVSTGLSARCVGVGAAVRSIRGLGLASGLLSTQELAGIVPLEGGGEIVQEVDQDGGRLVRQLQRQYDDG